MVVMMRMAGMMMRMMTTMVFMTGSWFPGGFARSERQRTLRFYRNDSNELKRQKCGQRAAQRLGSRKGVFDGSAGRETVDAF